MLKPIAVMSFLASFLIFSTTTLHSQSIPTGSSFTPPAPNACQSLYDRYYQAEPGVYAYWALCETGSPMQIYDYAGKWDLASSKGMSSLSAGTITGGVAGPPIGDGETAAQAAGKGNSAAFLNIVLNTHQGTLASWINADATVAVAQAMAFSARGTVASSVSLGEVQGTNGVCFNGNFQNSSSTNARIQGCGYAANTWHRVVFTWNAGAETLYVDGASVASGTYTGALINNVYFYSLFPGNYSGDTSKQMTLAKASIANVAWSAAQVASDYAPVLPTIPTGGVYVSNTQYGAYARIHKDVLGYTDNNQNIKDDSGQLAPLMTGLAAAGVTSLRYANGYAGISADEESWLTGELCVPAGTVPNTATLSTDATNVTLYNDSIDTYLPKVAVPLGLDVGFTVNYGSNPDGPGSACTAGGDPTINGTNLITHTNVQNNYNIKYWEIGNEQNNAPVPSQGDKGELDLHTPQNTGTTYAANEPAFYDALKAIDSTVTVGVPEGLSTQDTAWNTYTIAVLAGAKYDAAIYHNYPIKSGFAITDGDTIYPDRVASSLGRTRGELSTLQTALLNYNKRPDSIWVTEWNDEISGNEWSRQTLGAIAPLFAVEQLAEYMQAGVQYATWLAQGSGGCSKYNYDSTGNTAYNWYTGCGNSDLVYTGPSPKYSSGEVAIGLNPGDLTPVGRAFQLLSESGFLLENQVMVRTWTDVINAPWLISYGAQHNAYYAVILINRDRDNAHTVPVTMYNKTSGTATQYTYGKAQYDFTKAISPATTGDWSKTPVTTTIPWSGGTLSVILPPWSVSVVITNH